MSSTPGYCVLSKWGTTIGEALGWDGIRCDPTRLEYFRSLVKYRWDLMMSGRLDFDNIKTFVKQEPHKASKIAEGRFRLISAVSVVDTMIDRILFSVWHRRALETVGETPCLLGWSPLKGGYRFLQRRYRGRNLCLDKSLWDWTVTPQMVYLWYWFVINLANNPPQWWKDMVLMRFKALYRDARFEFSDGVVVVQPGWGIQKSGCFLTLILNSVGQSFCHYLANHAMGRDPQENEPHAIGDDTIQPDFPDVEAYVEEIQRLGYTVKEVNRLDYIEFAGFIVKDDVCWPSYWQKHCYLLQRVDPRVEVETLDSYQRIYAFEPLMLAVIQANLGRIDPSRVIPAWQLQRDFDGL